MPHLTIEYSANLAALADTPVLRELNAAVTSSPEVPNEAGLKTRLVPMAGFQVGTSTEPRAFIHAQLRLLAGRSPEAKRDLAGRVAGVLRRLAPRPAGVLVQLSVEVADMDRDSYVQEKL
ncbi:5-carboxymethyl-2-hydroxymuconate Delta-isomerase [Ramlibacter sp. H39-3-26]|uniref:5-carboxymethyl-2-hydroxymuconate Delta-isomerase n=1 Tax=Curvibacter soli TaxID=3031331 RepID=UPI0023DA9310|nr:5-carboxymethyl-2-hydroxymuconate Delta-isomerase [Ramlibacter sp. H39-3-26]MDF1484666.1 5-carboxymethyl-2-hydroxymuconate Delta-isomerase [Ramlibacter sp. H39-3-26]